MPVGEGHLPAKLASNTCWEEGGELGWVGWGILTGCYYHAACLYVGAFLLSFTPPCHAMTATFGWAFCL